MKSNHVIIAPKEYHNLIRQLERHDDIFSNPKLFTKDEIVEAFFGRLDSSFLLELFKRKQYSYSLCKKIVSFIPFIKNSSSDKEKELLSLYEEANSKQLVQKNDYLFEFLKRGVDVYVYKNDRILNYIFKSKGVDDIEYKELPLKNKGSDLLMFKNEREESHFIINKILDLVSNGVNINDIYIYGAGCDNSYYLNYFSNKYSLHLNGLPIGNEYSSTYYKEFKKLIFESNTFDDAMTQLDKHFLIDGEDYVNLKNLLIENWCDSLDVNDNLSILDNELRNSIVKTKKYTNSVNIMQKPNLLQGKYIFVIDFNNKKYPNLHTDKDYISDAIKARNYLNTSTETNTYSKEEMLTFLRGDNSYIYTFSARGSGGTKYLSYLVDDLNLVSKNIDFMPYDFNKDMARFSLSMMQDVLNKYKDKNPYYDSYYSKLDNDFYNTYDNEIDEIHVIEENQFLKLSYTSINGYDSCPFSYFVSRILGLQDDGNTFGLNLGNLVHKSFELSYQNGLPFKDNFKDVFSTLEFSNIETIFIESLYPTILEAYQFSIAQLKTCKNYKFTLERNVDYKLDDNTMIVGAIDKAIVTENENLFLLDYKTGNKDHTLSYKNVREKEKMQLPTYLLLASVDDELSKYKVRGLYYDNIFPEKYNVNEKYDHKYKGVSIFDPAILSTFDEIEDNKGKYINGFSVSTSKPNENFVNEIDFQLMKETTKEYYQDVIVRLRSNDFRIMPGKDACKYCTFKDICFYKKAFAKDEEDDE